MKKEKSSGNAWHSPGKLRLLLGHTSASICCLMRAELVLDLEIFSGKIQLRFTGHPIQTVHAPCLR